MGGGPESQRAAHGGVLMKRTKYFDQDKQNGDLETKWVGLSVWQSRCVSMVVNRKQMTYGIPETMQWGLNFCVYRERDKGGNTRTYKDLELETKMMHQECI